ncbi:MULTISPECIES: acyl-CoA dehydrogenase family protein [unclassified Mycobacterium]|uniref:acyl-CoA dehydrogenase family protein n=1 Tax=unclassified Mycobacterium TaxID=2642494 RepID=UPI00068A814A|nr:MULTISPECIES: acyl-CoA dehydrogenase family protein [unclassified Mycobacterium]SEA62269.1 Acyl-CoA dehydrogenase [Mycobacterium sp. 283mftsu]
MRFGFSEDQEQIQLAASQLLAKRSGFDVVRAHAEARSSDADLSAQLGELGWPAIAIPEEFGGAGLGLVEAAILLEAHGYSLAPTGLFGTAAAAALIGAAGSDEQKNKWLPGLASGELTAAVGTPQLIADAADADLYVIYSGGSAALMPPDTVQIVDTIDPTRSYGRLADALEGEALNGNVAAGLAHVEVLISAELVGVGRRAVDTTVDYVKQRRQFDRAVGSFQAVSHKCVQMYLGTESARTATYYAAWAVDTCAENMQEAVALVRAIAGEGVLEATAAAIQLHGGIGFTWEADLHWLYKRAQLMSSLLGPSRRHQAALARLSAARLGQSALQRSASQ